MTFKEQLIKLKDNWLLIALALLVFFFLNLGEIPFGSLTSFEGTEMLRQSSADAFSKVSRGSYGAPPPMSYSSDFAPDVADRKITKSSSMVTEVKSGTFKDAESKLKSIIKSSSSYLLSENVNKYDNGWRSYYTGSYQIKVDSKKFEDVANQLKDIGEVKSFNENAQDITASFKNLDIEINAEKERLLSAPLPKT